MMMSGCRDVLTMSNEGVPKNKRRKKEASPSTLGLLDSLPDEVAISCLARLSRLDQATLSLVSKRYRSMVVSPEFYQARSLMGYADKYLYICISSLPPGTTPLWFILGKNKAHSIPSFPSGSAVVAFDCGIYVIGGLVNGKRTSDVLLLNCRSHKWHQVTSMSVARASAAASVVDGKIYVLGGCADDKNYSDWGEVFDPKAQTWDALPMPILEEDKETDHIPRMSLIHDSVVIEDKIYVVDTWNRSLFYSPTQCKWGRGNHDSNPKNRRDWCVIDNLLYTCSYDGKIYWCEPGELNRCDTVGMNWRAVNGWDLQLLQLNLWRSRLVHFGGEMARAWESEMILDIPTKLEDLLPGARLTNFGRNVLVFWDVLVGPAHKSLEIWCAEISFKRCKRGWIWGKVEWANAIFTADPLLCRPKAAHRVCSERQHCRSRTSIKV